MSERYTCVQERETNFISYDTRTDLQNIVDKQEVDIDELVNVY